MSNKKYTIIPIDEINLKLINSSTSTKIEDVRKSNDGKLCILELISPIPEWILSYQIYHHEEILKIISASDWSEKQEDSKIDSIDAVAAK